MIYIYVSVRNVYRKSAKSKISPNIQIESVVCVCVIGEVVFVDKVLVVTP